MCGEMKKKNDFLLSTSQKDKTSRREHLVYRSDKWLEHSLIQFVTWLRSLQTNESTEQHTAILK